MDSILRVENLSKSYPSGDSSLTVLKNIQFDVAPGSKMAIVGPSGSGKTTLLGLCAGLDKASTGDIQLHGSSLASLNEDQRVAIRNEYVGFIFQNFQLIPTLTALENVMVPLELQGKSGAEEVARELLTRVGLGDRYHPYHTQLSGGEQQRVALARAFSNRPRILFADEPTGNLDDETSAAVEELMFELNQEAGTTLIIVTHDPELAEKTDRIIRLKGGEIVSDNAA